MGTAGTIVSGKKIITDFRKNSGGLIALGIVMLLLGAAGLYLLYSEVSLPAESVRYLGGLLIAGGLFQLFDVYKAEQWSARASHFVTSLVYLCAGIVMIVFPVESSELLVMAVGFSLVVVGASRILLSLQARKYLKRWIALLIGGLLSIGMGAMLIAQWASPGDQMIVLFVSLELILQGLCMIYIAAAARHQG